MTTWKKLPALMLTICAGAAVVRAATNVNPPVPGTEQTVKEARVFETYSLIGLKRVFFDSGRAELSTDEAAALGRLVKQIRANAQSVIELRGYSDGVESVEQGNAMSGWRAQTVALYFADHGIAAHRIRMMAFQEAEDPGAASNSEHRRVDVRLFVPPPSERP